MDQEIGVLDAGVLDVDCSGICIWHDQVIHEDLLLDALSDQQSDALGVHLQWQNVVSEVSHRLCM